MRLLLTRLFRLLRQRSCSIMKIKTGPDRHRIKN